MNNKWINVKDKLPESNCDCLIYDSVDKCILIGFYQSPIKGKCPGAFKSNRVSMSGNAISCINFNISHWMPLPEPPKENYGIKNCKNCKHSTWELDGAGDETNYFCCKNPIKLVEKFYCCNEWENNGD